jgi:hypothetical protein
LTRNHKFTIRAQKTQCSGLCRGIVLVADLGALSSEPLRLQALLDQNRQDVLSDLLKDNTPPIAAGFFCVVQGKGIHERIYMYHPP